MSRAKSFPTVDAAKGYVEERSRAYKLALGSPAGQEILIDLAEFCRANESTFAVDPRDHARLEGRREVWLRLQQHMNLSPDQLFAILSGVQFNTNPGNTDA